MRIIILGTRGEIEESHPEHKLHSGILVDSLLFDIGEEAYLEFKPKFVFITHLHPDHVFFLKEGKERVVDPEKYEKAKDCIFFSPEIPEGVEKNNWVKVRSNSIDLENYVITPIPTIHSKKVKSVGYLIQSGYSRIFYSGDMIWIKKKYHDILRDLDLVITDGSFMREKGMVRRDKETGEIYGHNGIPTLAKLFQNLGAKKIVFTHFGSEFINNPEEAEKKVKAIGENIEIAKDGSIYYLPNKSVQSLSEDACIPSIEYDLKNAKERWRELNADHRYLHIGYIKIKNGGKWGDWTLEKIIRCHARIVDELRKLYFPYIPVSEDRPNLRELDLESRKFEKTDPPKSAEEVKEWEEKRRALIGESEEMNIEGIENVGTKDIEAVIPKKIADVGPKEGIYLVEPHAKWIATGYKTAFVKSRKFEINENEPYYLLGDGVCYGYIWVGSPQEISLEEFKRLEEKHRIDEETRKKWCEQYEQWCTGPLYFYPITKTEIFAIPIPVTIPKGVQMFVKKENIIFEDIKALPTGRVKKLHILSHELKSLKLHEKVVKELTNRKEEHEYIDFLDRVQEFLIQDWKTYDPMELIKTKRGRKVLLDDHRIVHAWWSILKKGKRLESEQFKDYSLEEQKKIVRELWEKIVKAMKVLGYRYKPLEETSEELKFDPQTIKRENLEEIDDVFVKKLKDDELIGLDKRLHELYKEIGKVTEPLHNAHVFVWKEMFKRRIEHEIEDPLTEATALEVIEYPTPRGFASENLAGKGELLPLQRILKAFPERFTIYDPPAHIHLCGSSVNKERSLPGHDIDILVKQAYPDQRLIRELIRKVEEKDPEVAERLSLVFDPHGPQVGYSIPLYRLSFERTSPEEWVKHSPWEYLAKLEVGKPIRALKAATGFNKNEFFDAESLWKNWAASRINKGIVIQKKYDGMRFHIHRKGDKVWVITEDRQRDRASVFKKSIKELLENVKADNFVIDAEMVEYDCKGKKVFDKEEVCEAKPREEMIPWVVAEKRELDDENVVFHVHDCMIFNNEDITQKPYVERFSKLREIFPKKLEHWRIVWSKVAKTKNEFDKYLAMARRLKGSEGAMLKVADSVYKLTGRTPEWAKIKNVKEIDVMVWDVIQKKSKKTGQPIPGQYMYECVFEVPCDMKDKIRDRDFIEYKGKCYAKIGRSYSTAIKAERGDILTITPIRVAEFEDEKGKKYWTWMFPIVKVKHPSKKEPDTIDTVRKLVKVGTAPLTSLSDEVVVLKTCPFWKDDLVCPLKWRFLGPVDFLSKKRMYLRFPVACSLAYYFKCRYVKKYYYDYIEEASLKGEEIKEEGECGCSYQEE